MYNKLVSKEAKIAVVGLGYIGLPLALEFSKFFSVIGFDINENTIESLNGGIDPSGELSHESFLNRDVLFTSDSGYLEGANFFIIAVPTPIDRYNKPDLSQLLSATKNVAQYMHKGDYVVFESTVYPGCTMDDCVPLIEEISGMKACRDFKVGYSPERINPGDMEHSIQNTVKIVSACSEDALEEISAIYGLIVMAGIHKAPSIMVAEAAKIIENTQRDVNIALMNELSIIFGRMGINTLDVIQAATTKWNFIPYTPGLVGGHCIGVDPYYMVHKAAELKYHPQMIASGRFVNDSMGSYIAKQVAKKLLANNLHLLNAKVLIMGITYKEGVSDTRNTKVIDIISELHSYKVDTDVIDPRADPACVENEYGIKMIERVEGRYDGIILAVPHKEYADLSEDDFKLLLNPGGVLMDIKGVLRGKITEIDYWSL